MTNFDRGCRPLAKLSLRVPTIRSSALALAQGFPVGVVLSTVPPRHRDRYSGALRILSTITPEFCPRPAGISVHITLETLSVISRNNQPPRQRRFGGLKSRRRSIGAPLVCYAKRCIGLNSEIDTAAVVNPTLHSAFK